MKKKKTTPALSHYYLAEEDESSIKAVAIMEEDDDDPHDHLSFVISGDPKPQDRMKLAKKKGEGKEKKTYCYNKQKPLKNHERKQLPISRDYQHDDASRRN